MSCDLLSNQYLCTLENSIVLVLRNESIVVICFQISIFARQRTAKYEIVDLQACCDLLSNQYLCTLENSHAGRLHVFLAVVICFQISIFARQRTALLFKFMYRHSCDLLSNQYLCTLENSKGDYRDLPIPVVICFQISIFARQRTAPIVTIFVIEML